MPIQAREAETFESMKEFSPALSIVASVWLTDWHLLRASAQVRVLLQNQYALPP